MPIHSGLVLTFGQSGTDNSYCYDYNYDIVIMCEGKNPSDRNFARLFKLKYCESVRNTLVRGRFCAC